MEPRMMAKSKKGKGKNKDMNKTMKNNFRLITRLFVFLLLPLALIPVKAQEQPPTPSAPRSAKIPAIVEKRLPNGLRVATVERKNVPLVTVQLLVKSGAGSESM